MSDELRERGAGGEVMTLDRAAREAVNNFDVDRTATK